MSVARMPSKDYIRKFRLAELLDEAANECYLAQSQDPCGFFVNHFTLRGGMNVIDNVTAREVLDATGTPTIEIEVHSNGRIQSCVAASQCTSFAHPCPTCIAVSVRDNDEQRHNGLGQKNQVGLIQNYVGPKMIGLQLRQSLCDKELRAIDGTKNNAKLGVYTVAAVSAAIAMAAGSVTNRPAFLPLAEEFYHGGTLPRKFFLPIPVISAINPNVTALGKGRLREVVIFPNPLEFARVSDALAVCSKVIRVLGKLLHTRFGEGSDAVGSEGGYLFSGFDNIEHAVTIVEDAVKEAGYALGRVVQLGVYVDGDLLYHPTTDKYTLVEGQDSIGAQLSDIVVKLAAEHPAVVYLEDVHHSKDFIEHRRITSKLGLTVTVVGGRIYSTLAENAAKGAHECHSTACMLRLNDVGTITEVFQCARSFNLRGGALAVTGDNQEMCGALLADLAVSMGARYLRAGGLLRGEKVAAYNRLILLQEYLEKHEMFTQAPTLDAIELPPPPPEAVPVAESAPGKPAPKKK